MANKSNNRKLKSVAGLTTATCLALLLTIGAAVVHGRLARRWGVTAEVQQAADRLVKAPVESFGSWHLEESHQLEQSVQELLECNGYTYDTYVNRSTGDVVTVAVILGPAGPIAVHTPEICYSSQQYKQTSRRQRDDLLDLHSLWAVSFRANTVDAQSFVVYYGWSEGDNWQASHDPRIEFAGSPYLYKLQLAGRSTQVDAEADHAACRDFLKEYLPILKDRIVLRGSQPATHQG